MIKKISEYEMNQIRDEQRRAARNLWRMASESFATNPQYNVSHTVFNEVDKKMVTGQNQEGLKFDENKPRMDLLAWEALKGLANVMGFGAVKYGDHNWRKGIKLSRIYAAALRHLLASLGGEDLDPESGLDHIDHLGACWMFLSTFKKTRKDLDDRFKGDSGAK